MPTSKACPRAPGVPPACPVARPKPQLAGACPRAPALISGAQGHDHRMAVKQARTPTTKTNREHPENHDGQETEMPTNRNAPVAGDGDWRCQRER